VLGTGKRQNQGDWFGESSFCCVCKENGHNAQDCRRGNLQMHQGVQDVGELSGYVASLCATQVEGQAFLCIPDCPSKIHVRDRATTAVVTVIKGVVTSRQIEEEFTRILPKNWRWTARRVADNMFTARFPNALTIKD
jgi:hypothetical protein